MTSTRAFARQVNKGPREFYICDNVNFSSGDVLRANFADKLFSLMPEIETAPFPAKALRECYDAYAADIQDLGRKATLSVMPHADNVFVRRLESLFASDAVSIGKTSNGEVTLAVGAFDRMHKIFAEWQKTMPAHWSQPSHEKMGRISRNANVLTGIANNGGMTGGSYVPFYG